MHCSLLITFRSEDCSGKSSKFFRFFPPGNPRPGVAQRPCLQAFRCITLCERGRDSLRMINAQTREMFGEFLQKNSIIYPEQEYVRGRTENTTEPEPNSRWPPLEAEPFPDLQRRYLRDHEPRVRFQAALCIEHREQVHLGERVPFAGFDLPAGMLRDNLDHRLGC